MAHSTDHKHHLTLLPPADSDAGLPVEYFSGRRAFAQTRHPVATLSDLALARPRRYLKVTDKARRTWHNLNSLPKVD